MRHELDEPCQGVVAGPAGHPKRPVRDVALESTGVRQQVRRRQRVSRPRVAQSEIGHVIPDGSVEADLALLRQTHHHRGDHGLGYRRERDRVPSPTVVGRSTLVTPKHSTCSASPSIRPRATPGTAWRAAPARTAPSRAPRRASSGSARTASLPPSAGPRTGGLCVCAAPSATPVVARRRVARRARPPCPRRRGRPARPAVRRRGSACAGAAGGGHRRRAPRRRPPRPRPAR